MDLDEEWIRGHRTPLLDPQRDWNLVDGILRAEVHEVESPESKTPTRMLVPTDPSTKHVGHFEVMAVLIVDVMAAVSPACRVTWS